jgi:C_GCAxxG_C_C family probable redox protein
MEKSPSEIALERFDAGYSCAQAVFAALAPRAGVDPDLALRIAAAFGGGMARTAGPCGAATGALMYIGLEQPGAGPEHKDGAYEAGRAFLSEFAARNGSTVCRELLGCDISTAEGRTQAREGNLFRTRCRDLVRDAVEICLKPRS